MDDKKGTVFSHFDEFTAAGILLKRRYLTSQGGKNKLLYLVLNWPKQHRSVFFPWLGCAIIQEDRDNRSTWQDSVPASPQDNTSFECNILKGPPCSISSPSFLLNDFSVRSLSFLSRPVCGWSVLNHTQQLYGSFYIFVQPVIQQSTTCFD